MKFQILKCTTSAIQRAADLCELIRTVLVDDREKRFGFIYIHFLKKETFI